MDSSDLFSHRQTPHVASASSSQEPVQAPVFSDQPNKNKNKNTTADSPSS